MGGGGRGELEMIKTIEVMMVEYSNFYIIITIVIKLPNLQFLNILILWARVIAE